jgi:hypothetical protein
MNLDKWYEELTPEEKEEHDEFCRIMKEYDNNIDNKNNEVFKEIKKLVGDKYLKDVKDCLEQSECYDIYELVEKPNIEPQEEDWNSFNHILVDQYRNGGFTGDDFAGYIFIPIKENIYLKAHYSM